MGTLLINDATGAHAIPLCASTLVGRHFLCCYPIVDPTIHLYWLEIRWSGDRWLWRILAGEERTRGPGAIRDGIWRELNAKNARGGRIVWDDRCSVEIVDDSPPQLAGRCLRTGTWLDADAAATLVEPNADGTWHVIENGEHCTDAVVDDNGRPVQVYLPGSMKTPTSSYSLNIPIPHRRGLVEPDGHLYCWA